MTLEKIKHMGDLEIQSWLKKVGSQGVPELVMALMGADGDVQARILKNMSPLAGQMLKEQLKKAGSRPVSPTEIQKSAAALEHFF
ncbi:MAG: hypothetical protein LWX83_02640 [Anaerolineae bacterium]|nr:hypothetical protein [Anaerolineae bacterium]